MAIPLAADVERFAEAARAWAVKGLDAAEHGQAVQSVEAYAKAQAVFFLHAVVTDVIAAATLTPPGSAAALIGLLESAVGAAVERFSAQSGSARGA